VMGDKDGNEPIEGAIVTLEDGQTTKTNKNGVFNLLVVIGTEIEISHKEFDTKKVKIENAVVSVLLNKALVTFDMTLLKDVRIPQNKAQPIQIAYYYFINNQYKESAKVFEKYSEALSADDVYTWGDCYWKMGKFKEAINDYWTKAAARGNEDANYQLGVYNAELKKDNEKAIIFMDKVSQNHKNYSDAQLILGLCNATDNILKVKYLTNAAAFGNSEAMYQLGEHFKAQNDPKMANEWFKNACILKNKKACLSLKDEF
jgi:tetratricopeptide (TPR) repeat protein